jgi:hypothetical protein
MKSLVLFIAATLISANGLSNVTFKIVYPLDLLEHNDMFYAES